MHLLDDLSSSRTRYSQLAARGRGSLSVERFTKELAAVRVEQEKLWRLLRVHSPIAEILARQVTITDIQHGLPVDGALVEFARYLPRSHDKRLSAPRDERYVAYIVWPNRFTWVDLGPAAPIDAQIQAFRTAIIRNADTIPPGQALYDSIMQPIVDRLGTTTNLFIAPDGDLNLVPFDALVDEYSNYLVERFRLHYITSGRDLLRPWNLESVTDGPTLIVANPAGTDLPGTEREATLLASLLPDAITIQNGDATETELRTHGRPRILHIATHGTFGVGRPEHTIFDTVPNHDSFRLGTSVFDGLPPTQLDNPMLYSWLDLAPPTAPVTDADLDDTTANFDDGRLTAYEVSGWDLRGTELVTLSACETAQGTYQQGEGILGLRRAFAIAGAQTQVMSLWKVSDSSAAKLMDSYYNRLLSGEGRSEAMRNTQLEMLRHAETRHPRHWAAFVVVGERAPLSGTAPDGPPHLIRPRGCQARINRRRSADSTFLLLLVLLALTRRRRSRTD